MTLKIITTQTTKILPNFLVTKFVETHTFRRVFSNLHHRKLGEISVFCVVNFEITEVFRFSTTSYLNLVACMKIK